MCKLMTEKEGKKNLVKLGEFGLIHLLTDKVKLKNKSSVLGIGDDSAILEMGDKLTVISTDMLTEGIHFNLVYTPLKHLGYKAVIVNLSDIYAMNAIPTQILVSIAFSSRFTTEMIEELYEGIHLACNVYGVDLVGGDTTSSLTGMTISITAIGAAPKGKIVFRSGAQENDLVCVSGDLGGAYMGLQLLERELQVFDKSGSVQPEFEGHDYILERQLKPEARRDIINLLSEKEILPTSMIDISDGLSSELLHICDSSGKGCKIYADKIPIAGETIEMAEELNIEPLTASLNGGEDYELLFTVSLQDFEKVSSISGISIIGHISNKSEGNYIVLLDGSLVEVSALGWNSFKPN
jgi:thiamine-monophosphate kinase